MPNYASQRGYGLGCPSIPRVTFPAQDASINAKGKLGVYSPVVTHLRKFGVFAMLFAALLTPTMACAVADSPMTSEERACCQMMKNHCGEKGMPASHGCCKKIPGGLYDNALNTKGSDVSPCCSARHLVAGAPGWESHFFLLRMDRTPRLLSSKAPTFDDFHS